MKIFKLLLGAFAIVAGLLLTSSAQADTIGYYSLTQSTFTPDGSGGGTDQVTVYLNFTQTIADQVNAVGGLISVGVQLQSDPNAYVANPSDFSFNNSFVLATFAPPPYTYPADAWGTPSSVGLLLASSDPFTGVNLPSNGQLELGTVTFTIPDAANLPTITATEYDPTSPYTIDNGLNFWNVSDGSITLTAPSSAAAPLPSTLLGGLVLLAMLGLYTMTTRMKAPAVALVARQ